MAPAAPEEQERLGDLRAPFVAFVLLFLIRHRSTA
jgi:hypothetical protein